MSIKIFFLILHENVCCGYSLEVPTTSVFMDDDDGLVFDIPFNII